MNEEYAIIVENLTRKFGDFVAVDHISFRVRKGEIFGFLGPNGAGKSTTIRMLCGLLMPSEGTALVAGYDVAHEPERVKQNIGYMSQRFSLYLTLTVRENMLFYGRAYRVPEEVLQQRVRSTLELLELMALADRLTSTLSVGWRQRLALACALLHEPRIVFLDEPTAGVDPIARRKFWDIIHTLADRGVTVLVTTHYMDEAEFCEHIVLIHRGKIIAEGPPRRLKEQIPAHLFEVALDKPYRALRILQHQPQVVEVSLFGIRLHVGLHAEMTVEEGGRWLTRFLREHGFHIQSVAPIVATLEDVFIYLTEKRKA